MASERIFLCLVGPTCTRQNRLLVKSEIDALRTRIYCEHTIVRADLPRIRI